MQEFTTSILEVDGYISKGAEAKISLGRYHQFQCVMKQRERKKYRNPDIDMKLRKERTIQEIRILQLADMNNLPVPKVYDLDKETWTIIMERIKGEPLKQKFSEIDPHQIFTLIGKLVGELHDLNIIHGDLTTSNILLNNDGGIYFIDFGLGFISTSIEDRAVDNLVLKHTLESSHSTYAEQAYNAFIEGYKQHSSSGEEVMKRMKIVEERVRYRSHTED